MNNKHVLYIAYATHIEALNVASDLTLQTLRSLGFHVQVMYATGNVMRFAGELLHAATYLPDVQYLYIIIDGRGALDKFSLLKLFNPRLQLIWEIHGHPKEPLWQTNALKIRFISMYRSFQRKILAKLVNASISTTDVLARYARGELAIPRSVILPSCVDLSQIQTWRHSGPVSKKIYFSRNSGDKLFIVFWGGGSYLHWQALDILEKVAQYTYSRDKHILFVVVGSEFWHTFAFQKNIVFFHSVPHSEMFRFIDQADVCLALYHDRSLGITGLPFYYSPRKIIEYMSCRKAVIASKIRGLEGIIRHGVNGYLCSNEPEKLYAYIRYLRLHPQMKEKVGTEAYRTVTQHYTTAQQQRIVGSVFTDVLK